MKMKYKCTSCGKTAEAEEGMSPPECCGKLMALKLDTCTSAPHAEMARNTDEDEPCDDGR